MDFLHYFEQETDFENNYWGDNYIEPWVSCTRHKVKYNKTEYEKLISMPLTFEMLEDGSIIFTASSSSISKTIKYRKNGGALVSITSSTGGMPITVKSGDVIQFYGNNTTYSTSGNNYCTLKSSAEHKIKGNIMSLISESNFRSLNSFDSTYALASLFYGSTGLTDASELFLPAETLTNQCYYRLFYNCTNLATAPVLPAKNLAAQCYYRMFYGCTSLTGEIDLPSEILVNGCYSQMFQRCSNVNYIKLHATSNLEYTDYRSPFYQWLTNVSSTGTIVKPLELVLSSGTSGIPSGWTVETLTV